MRTQWTPLCRPAAAYIDSSTIAKAQKLVESGTIGSPSEYGETMVEKFKSDMFLQAKRDAISH